MKRLLAFLALCLPICLFAQGFGSFSGDQPFLAKDRTNGSGASTYATNLTFRWVATDVTNTSYVTNWVDRIAGRELLTNGAPVVKDLVNGQGLYVQGVTNASSAGPLLGGFRPSGDPRISNLNTNNGETFALGWMLKMQGQIWGGSSPAYGFYNYNTNVGASHRFVLENGYAPFDKSVLSFASDNYGGASYVGDWMDFAVVCSNYNSQSFEWWFTNGVFVASTVATAGSDGQWPFTSTLAGVSNQLAAAYQGYVQEIWFRTNAFGTTGDYTNFAKDLHATRLAYYNTNYAIPSWPSLANNPTTNSDSLSVYDVASITGKSNGDTVASIPDSGPKAYHLRTTNSPLYLVNASTNGGAPHIGFNLYGGTNQMAGTNFSTTYPQPTTIIMVFDGASSCLGGNVDFILDNCQAPGTADIAQQLTVDSTYLSLYSGSAPLTSGTTRPNLTGLHVWEVYYKQGSTYLKRDGEFYSVAGSTGTDGRQGIALAGARNWDMGSGYTPNLNFYWMGIYTNTLSTSTRSNIYSYLGNRFSIPVRINQN